MSRGFAGGLGIFAVVMLLIQFLYAEAPNYPVAAFWAVVLFLAVYLLWFKKPKET